MVACLGFCCNPMPGETSVGAFESLCKPDLLKIQETRWDAEVRAFGEALSKY